MNRGEVWWVDFDPSVGGEIKKQRPAVIVSNNISNKYLNRVQVVPLSSRIQKLYPSEVYVQFAGKQAKALADQITTVSKLRLLNRGGSLTQPEVEEIDRVLRVQLAL